MKTKQLFLLAALLAVLNWPLLFPGATVRRPAGLDAPGARYLQNNDILKQYLRFGVARRAILGEGTLPAETPYLSGGYPLLAYPEDGMLSPVTPLALLFGEVLGVRLALLLLAVAGGVGAYLFGRRLGLSPTGALYAAVCVSTGGFVVGKLRSGIVEEGYALLFPLLAYFFFESGKRPRLLLAAAACLAATLVQGKYLFLILPGFLALLVLLGIEKEMSAEKRDGGDGRVRLLARLVLVVFLAAALGLFKIVPMARLLLEDARVVPYFWETRNHLETPVKLLVSLLVGLEPSDAEISMAIGPAALLAGTWLLAFRIGRAWRWGVALLFSSAVCLGPGSPLNLARLVWSLPFFHSMTRLSDYFNFFPVLCFAVLAGRAVSMLEEGATPRRLAARGFLLFQVLFALLLPHFWKPSAAYYIALPSDPKPSTDFHLRGGFGQKIAKGLAYRNFLEGAGSMEWDADLEVKTAAVPRYIYEEGRWAENPRYKGEAYLENGRGAVKILKLGSREIEIDVAAETPARLTVNRNAGRWWRCDSGRVVKGKELLAIDLPAGKHRVRWVHRPLDFYLGLALSLAALALAAAHAAGRISTRLLWAGVVAIDALGAGAVLLL